jgi:hypothetical protein
MTADTIKAAGIVVFELFFQNQFTDVTKDKNAFVIDGTTRKNEDSNAHVNTLALKIGVYF